MPHLAVTTRVPSEQADAPQPHLDSPDLYRGASSVRHFVKPRLDIANAPCLVRNFSPIQCLEDYGTYSVELSAACTPGHSQSPDLGSWRISPRRIWIGSFELDWQDSACAQDRNALPLSFQCVHNSSILIVSFLRHLPISLTLQTLTSNYTSGSEHSGDSGLDGKPLVMYSVLNRPKR